MAAVMLLAVSLTYLFMARNNAVAQAADARSLAAATRLAEGLGHTIAAGRLEDLFDGYAGDFTDEGFPEMTYLIGVGDGSIYASPASEDISDSERAWREQAATSWEETEGAEGEDVEKPELTRVFITVFYIDMAGEEKQYQVERMLPTWAVDRDFELHHTRWGDNFPEKD